MSHRVNQLLPKGLRQWAYQASGFNQLGLMRDDCLNELRADVQEALRRLPKHIRDDRNFRIVRALQLDMQKRVLPKDQWTKLENDVLYLQPFLKEVNAEWEEKAKWNAE